MWLKPLANGLVAQSSRWITPDTSPPSFTTNLMTSTFLWSCTPFLTVIFPLLLVIMFFTVRSFVTLPLSLTLILFCVLPTPFIGHFFQDVIMTDSWRVNSESFWKTDLVFCTNTVYLMSATSLTSHLTWTGDHWRVIARGSWHIKPVQVLNPRNRCAKSSADDVHVTLFPLSFIPSVFPYSYSSVSLFHHCSST